MTSPPLGESDAQRRRSVQLVQAKRRATGLLALATAVFVVSTVFARQGAWLGWVQATAVASMVGGLADWFAVTALFRRPLGLPIPHTAIVVERKDRFAETLGTFVQESFLNPDAVIERLHSARAVRRAAEWLADPDHAEALSGRAADAVAGLAGVLSDEEVHDAVTDLLRDRLGGVPLAPLAGRALARLTEGGRHQPTVDAALAALAGYLKARGPELHLRLGTRAPWWLPDSVESRLVKRLLDRGAIVLADMAVDRSHPLRRQVDDGLARLAGELQTSPDLLAKGEQLKAELLTQPDLRLFAAALWRDTKAQLRRQAADPASPLRRRLAVAAAGAGQELLDDARLEAAAERAVDAAARAVLGRFDRELADLVSGTIARWNAAETSLRLELLLGPDLQYIRINGTLVGAFAGLILHAATRALT